MKMYAPDSHRENVGAFKLLKVVLPSAEVFENAPVLFIRPVNVRIQPICVLCMNMEHRKNLTWTPIGMSLFSSIISAAWSYWSENEL